MNGNDARVAGAAAGTGRHLYYRLVAVNVEGDTTRSRSYPYLQAVLPQGEAAKRGGTRMRVATFNVRTAKARSDKRHWQVRKDEVAQEIVDSGASVVAIQEMSPGRADGKSGSTLKIGRQTTTLLTELEKIGAEPLQAGADDLIPQVRGQARQPRGAHPVRREAVRAGE